MKKIDLDLILKDKVVCLKPLPSLKVDPDYLANLANDPIIAKWMGNKFPSPYTKKDAEDFLKKAKKSWESQEEYIFIIFVGNKYIGNIGISVDFKKNIVWNLGYWLGKKYEGKGYATRAVALLSKFCFFELALNEIRAGVYEGNSASMNVLIKNDFEIDSLGKEDYPLADGEIVIRHAFVKLKQKPKILTKR